MKTKHIKYLAALTIGCQFLGACSDEFLEVDPVGQPLEDSFYQNREQAYQGLVAAYDPIGWAGTYINKTFPLDAASDNFHCGGGHSTDNNHVQVWDKYTVTPVEGPQTELWAKGYSGVYRCNILIKKLPDVTMDDNERARFMAEAKFLRAYYYFDLIRLFERIPLITAPLNSTEIYTVEQVDRSLVFEQIEKDLLAAIPDLPPTVPLEGEAGRATEGAARALLGKVYLQQEKFGDAAAQFKIVNGTTPGEPSELGGYDLMENYADLWKVEHEFNKESIFEISHNSTSVGGWDNYGATEGNVMSILTGPRAYTVNEGFKDKVPDLVSGWSFLTPTESLIDAFVQGGIYDPRYASTIINVDSLADAGAINYTPHFEDTGYFLLKFIGRESQRATEGTVELNFPNNEYEIRLADTYLLEAEALVRGSGDATRAQALLDAVRARVGLDPVDATLENIYAERRLELAGEGHRWFDLVRTGRAATVLAHKGFVEGKHDALPIPLGELEFDNTLLEQDPAYK